MPCWLESSKPVRRFYMRPTGSVLSSTPRADSNHTFAFCFSHLQGRILYDRRRWKVALWCELSYNDDPEEGPYRWPGMALREFKEEAGTVRSWTYSGTVVIIICSSASFTSGP